MANTIKGLTIELRAEMKKFNQDMRTADKSIGNTQKQVDTLAKSLRLEWNTDRFAQAQKLAQSAIKQTEDKAKALRDEMSKLNSMGLSVDSDQYKYLQTEILKTETRVVELKAKLQQLRDLRIDELAGRFEKLGSSITGVGSQLRALSTTAAAILAAFVAVGSGAVNTADDLKTMADQLNLASVELERWQYIAMQSDVTDTELQAGLQKIQVALADLATGTTSGATDALQALNLSSEQAALGMSENFDLVIERLAAIDDETLQAALANEIFGDKMGAKMIPMLQQGGAGLAALSAEFETFNYMTDQEVNALSEFDNVINKIKYQFESMKNQLGVALLPIMRELASIVQEKIIPAVQRMIDWFSELTVSQQKTILQITAMVAALAPVLLIVGKLTSGIGSVIRTVSSLSGVFSALAAHPIIAVLGAIAAILVYLYNTNEEFKASINGLLQTLGSALQPILVQLGQVFNQVAQIMGIIIRQVADVLGPVFTALVPIIGTVLTAFSPLVSMLLDALIPILVAIGPALEAIFSIINPIIKTILSIVIPAISWVVDLMGGLISTMLDRFAPVIEFVGAVFTSVFSAIPEMIATVLQGIEDFVNGAIDLLNNLISGLNKVGEVLGFTVKEIEHVTITGEIKTQQTAINTPQAPITGQAVTSTSVQAAASAATSHIPSSVTTITTNDNSVRSVNIEHVEIKNYGAELGEEAIADLVNQINVRLAGSM
ncbi:MAG: hypothetical protein A2Y16_05370 [Tenericutes bacterium GWF2_57_13]|nr:MAG: hypothetical protein A2Y16_05370 [Tenericutes bacterium GWF2_57_13]